MNKRVALAAVVAAAASGAPAAAQEAPAGTPPGALEVGPWTLVPVLEARARGEYRFDVDDESHGLLVERARLGLDATGGAVEARVVLQDARAIALTPDAPPITGPPVSASTGAFEAWAEAHAPGASPSFVRVGRQAVSWGEGRLLGSADWSPAGRTLDAIRARGVVRDGAVELLAAVLEDPSTGASFDAYGEIFGARAQLAFDPLLKLEAYALARVAQQNPLASLDDTVLGQTYTGSLRLYGDTFAWTWGVEGAGQLGWAQAFDEDRAAWALAGHAGHVFERGVLTPSVRLEGAFASGSAGGSRYGTFDPLLPDVHEWHGAMDLLAWSNEAEVGARVAAVPFTQGSVEAEYRYVRLVQAGGPWRTDYLTTIGAAPGNRAGELGHEIDAAFAWTPWAPVDLRVGYSVFVVGAGARAVLEAERTAVSGTPVGGVAGSVPAVCQFAYAQAGVALY